jgi:hypothetical protein
MDANTRINQLERELNILRGKYAQRGQHLSGLGQDPNTNGVIKEFFVYEEDFLALAIGTSAAGNINIQADSDFVLQKLTYFADVAAAGQTAATRVVPLATLQITDTGSGRNVMESAVPITSIFGTGELPFILPTPRLFLARSTIAITVANFDAADAYNIRLSFIGYKVYRL